MRSGAFDKVTVACEACAVSVSACKTLLRWRTRRGGGGLASRVLDQVHDQGSSVCRKICTYPRPGCGKQEAPVDMHTQMSDSIFAAVLRCVQGLPISGRMIGEGKGSQGRAMHGTP